MKNTLLVFVITLISLMFSIVTVGQKLELGLIGNQTTVEQGSTIEMNLSIIGVEGDLIHENNSEDLIIDIDHFRKRIAVTCNKVGENKIGPYRMNFNGTFLESNFILINVTAVSTEAIQKDTLVTLISPETVKINDEFSITLKSNVELRKMAERLNNSIKSIEDFELFDLESLKFRDSQHLKQIGYSSSSSVSTENHAENKFEYVFIMKAIKSGKIQINELSFNSNIKSFNTKTIKIKKE